MRKWTLASASLAPVALIGGWTVAAARQPRSYDAARDTISALAEHGAADRWIMTAGLAVLGVCHLVTASALSEAAPAGRVLLAVGGAATVVVAMAPQPSVGHVPAAAVGFVALAVWPAVARVPGRRSAFLASAVLLALLVWLAAELRSGELLGVSERFLAGAQALWPLLAVVRVFRLRHGAARKARRC